MSRSLAEYVNLRDLARQDAAFDVEAPLSAFERVAALSVKGSESRGGEHIDALVRVSLRASEGQRSVVLSGALEGTVSLICQRCLEPMDCSLAGPMLIAVSEHDEEVEGLPSGCELVSLLDAEELGLSLDEVCLLPLVEDELLLRIPLVPMHDEGASCAGRNREEISSNPAKPKDEISRPFSALADLMAAKGKGH
jgi:uncharacterized protein